jgi:iron complex transport system substrate-binding protein
MKKLNLIIMILTICFLSLNLCFALPVSFVDDSGKTIIIEEKPNRVVSLVPAITEIIVKLDATESLIGTTYHSTAISKGSLIKVVGGFFNPSIESVEDLKPDLIFVSSLHTEIKEYFKNKNIQTIELGTSSVPHGFDNILLLGKIFKKEKEALLVKQAIDDQIDLITQKLKFIGQNKRKRVMRLMGRDKVMTPGSDSFQNEMITLAGGIVHDFNRNGNIIEVTKEEWMKFNPEVLYGCGKDSEIEKNILNLPGWNNVDAVKNNRIYYFLCDLTCRAATNTGYFVQWLAASIYDNEFASKKNRIRKQKIKTIRKIDCNLDYVKDVRIDETNILDFKNRSLVIDLKKPMTTISTLEGQKDGVTSLVNHYTPPTNWLIDHNHGIDAIKKRICSALKLNKDKASILITGADMNNLAIKKEKYKELEVYAFITAGVNSNAMRMGRDQGGYYEPGTINIIIMSNMQMSKRAMTRAIITATEAKTAALLDLDIRTSYGDGAYRATGTGTDNVMIVQGKGKILNNAGGHTKLGELIATAVSKGVKEAIFNQNNIIVQRNIFQRLKKRGITIYSLIAKEKCDCGRTKNQFVGEVEALLLNPRYAGFMEMALSMSDDYEKGLIKDLSSFEEFSNTIAMEICGNNMEETKQIVNNPELPIVIEIALNALFNGIYHRNL